MKKIKIVNLVLLLVTLVLEILPYGTVLVFGNPEGADWHYTYSYFSLTPFGYAVFGPLITAIITCVLMLLSIIVLFKNSKKLSKIIVVFGCIAALASLSPLLYGLRYFNMVSLAISVSLIVFTAISFCVIRKSGQ